MRTFEILRFSLSAFLLVAFFPTLVIAASSPAAIPLDAAHWTVRNGEVDFVQQEGFPSGLLEMKAVEGKDDPVAILKDRNFASGTLEFDVKPDGDNWPTVRFHKTDARTAEEFYVRPSEDCAASDDCTQYAPIFNGRMLWDSFYQYQHSAPFRRNEWNHIKMVISGRRMDVYFNHERQPSLRVGELMGEATTGALEFQGPAKFANVLLRPGQVEGLAPQADSDPSSFDRGYIRSWAVTRPFAFDQMRDPIISDMPAASDDWQTLRAERFGLIDLARRFGPADTRDVPMDAWLKTLITSDRARVVHISIGFARRVNVFCNGQLAYSGRNLYNTLSRRRQPDGRLNVANGSFEMPLTKGQNQIVIALSSNDQDMKDIYSFGLEFRVADPRGLVFSR